MGLYKKIEEKVKEVIPLQRLAYVAFLHFESDEWGGMKFLESADAKLVCSDLSSKLNLTGWYNVPVDHISFWDNETLKTGRRHLRFIMTPHVHHWDSMMVFEETTKSLFLIGFVYTAQERISLFYQMTYHMLCLMPIEVLESSK